ncbi:acetylcholine receptor subunit delta-like [Mytilus trossulus]|uniref:acetylcholine receptor subunit delta-like n=1 Tax=Mytilus trossulus TaxID=6551 RepID=UPI0030045F97
MLVFIICFSTVSFSLCQNSSDFKALKKELFFSKEYDKDSKPVQDYKSTIYVNVELTLNSLITLDEVQQRLTTIGYLHISWYDEFLTWDRTQYGDLDYIYLPQSSIWKPDITLQDSYTEMEELGSDLILATIKHDGSVSWTPFQVFNSYCPVSMTFFPFDRQTCEFVFGAWSMQMNDISLLITNVSGIALERSIKENTIWTVVSTSVKATQYHEESRVIFSITLQRKPLYVMMHLVLPLVLLTLLNLFTFAIPADSGERMGYTVTVWLSFGVFLTLVGQSLPESSESISFMDIFIVMQLFQSTLVVLLSAVLSRLIARNGQTFISSCLLKRIVTYKRGKSVNTASEIKNDEKETQIYITWKEYVSTIDFCVFWCLLSICILLITALSFYTVYKAEYTLSGE